MKKYISIEKYLENKDNFKINNNYLKILEYILIIICLIIFSISIYNIIIWNIDNIKIHKLSKKINTSINLSNDVTSTLVNFPSNLNDSYYYYTKFPLYKVDFTELLKQNKDTVAFIKIKDTIISYPVLQTKDNDYYLNHSFDNKKNNAGWIFMDYRNNINTLSDNTIIYGHSRIDGTLFGTLRRTLTKDWQDNKDNYVIYFSTLKENMLFQIFSIYTIKEETYYLKTDFNSKEEKIRWLNTMKERNISPIDTIVSENDKILTLSTCLDTRGGRIVIQSKLIKIQKNT